MKANFSSLKLEGVTRRFGGAARGKGGAPGHAALDGLSLEIARGEFIALLGPSGCGKSTALNCIAGLLALSEGRILLDELRIDGLPPEQRGFGMVFQNYALFPHMTVARNVGFGLLMRGLPAAEIAARVARALELVQLGAHAGKLPGQLSGGQQQRVAIARAIVIEPPLILMDEPLSNLDAKLRLEMRTEIRRIHSELGRTTLYVTHDQDEALSLADRIVVMKDGVAQQIGTPQAVYGQPRNLAVARFMGYRNELVLDVGAAAGAGGATPAGTVVLQAAGISICGTAQGALGGKAVAAMRPDDFTIVASVASGAGAASAGNTLSAPVASVEYYGRETLFMLKLAGQAPLFVRAQGSARVGDVLTVAIPPERVLAYPAEPAA
ncbi:MAG TPA: ABC transporter ATP-binding protein [Polyangia bacterium]|nr:ABC transporter ATP-binding protein [Polyangia bacterium]